MHTHTHTHVHGHTQTCTHTHTYRTYRHTIQRPRALRQPTSQKTRTKTATLMRYPVRAHIHPLTQVFYQSFFLYTFLLPSPPPSFFPPSLLLPCTFRWPLPSEALSNKQCYCIWLYQRQLHCEQFTEYLSHCQWFELHAQFIHRLMWTPCTPSILPHRDLSRTPCLTSGRCVTVNRDGLDRKRV